ncbi:hypothetical protein PGTUg99_017293 [Puccinia graminis f. sp. tritici]|uniref:Uncharacterized protein n=1 Tax=Puccinia graminis f. sp. tritici TaxID=56615 RepID=A0A5B0N004_PUCGR|nr:hypothetical protein PGTUg99_017293 [Puccinia graminis f. sp. tritici]
MFACSRKSLILASSFSGKSSSSFINDDPTDYFAFTEVPRNMENDSISIHAGCIFFDVLHEVSEASTCILG